MAPTGGSTDGGTPVKVTGTNFTGATAVHFGSKTASFTVSSRTQIAATSPAGSTGTVDVTVTTPAGTSATSSVDRFIYTSSSTGTTYYVSNGGSDSNNGTSTSTPWQTLAHVNAFTFGPNDTLLLDGTSSFTGCLELNRTNLPKTSGSTTFTVGTYNRGSPLVRSDTSLGCNGYASGVVQLVGVSGVVVNGLTMRPGPLTNTQAGVNIQSNNPSGVTTITIENNDIGGFQYYKTSNAQFHATFSGTVMTVTDVISGEIRVGQGFNDTTNSFQGPPRVIGYGTGTGGAGTYTVTPSLTGRSCLAANSCKTAGNTGAEIWIDGTIYFIAGVHVLNNTLHGLSGTSSLDDIGIAGYGVSLSLGGNQYGHVYQGNLIYDIGGVAGIDVGPNGSGILSTNSTVAMMQFNLTHDLMDNTTTCGAGFAQWADVADRVTIQMGESYNNGVGRTQGCDSGSVDFDQSTTNSVAQYFYSHENFGPGILFFEGTNGGVNRYGPNTARYNISENDAQGGPNAGGIGCYNSGGSSYFPGDVYFYNNTEWMGTPHGTNGAFNTCVNMTGAVANNIFATAKNSSGLFAYILNCCGAGSTDNAVFSSNLYYPIGSSGVNSWNAYGTQYTTLASWQAAIPGGDAGAILAGSSPVSNGGSGGTCSWTPSTITSWSPSGCPSAYDGQTIVESAGKALSSLSGWPGGIPTRDYYGNTVPGSGSCYNIGAWGVCP